MKEEILKEFARALNSSLGMQNGVSEIVINEHTEDEENAFVYELNDEELKEITDYVGTRVYYNISLEMITLYPFADCREEFENDDDKESWLDAGGYTTYEPSYWKD